RDTILRTLNVVETVILNMNGDYETKGSMPIKEALMTTDSIKLFPEVITGKLREAAEPNYLGTSFFNKVAIKDKSSSVVYQIPSIGEIVASEVPEGGRYNTDTVELNTLESAPIEIRVKKIGLKVEITEETLADSNWDIIGMYIRKMGQAMARFKEEWIFREFSANSHVVFDNNLRTPNRPDAGTTGRGSDGEFNDTLAVVDLIEMCLALMERGFTPTDVIMHPLTWAVFAKNGMIGNGMTFGAFGGQNVHPWGAVQGTPGFAGLAANGNGQKVMMTPEQTGMRLPVPINISFSPYVNFDKVNKRFDVYVLDKDEVGCIAQKDELSTDEWTDPERDIKSLKVKERYGIGQYHHGKSVATARNIALDVTYPVPPTVTIKQ
ncbi:MAG: hypothetical protein ACRCS6_12515, partial [Turicibacter sp.]